MHLHDIEPKELWKNFADLNAIPRPSKKEEKVIEFIMQYGKKIGLETIKDEVGNVIIKKPATKGFETKKTVVLQSHLDMVHQKNNDTVFDFETQGIEMYVDQDWIKAKGTTLGADNGIGVATIMTILADKSIEHPALEALFTIDEETGMTGALHLRGGLLNGKILLNLDTEDDNELTIGCAGGIDVTATGKYSSEAAPDGHQSYQIYVKGLTGGHSGMDIYLGRANANKLMNRVIWGAFKGFSLKLASIDGGSLRNAIPRESMSQVYIPQNMTSEFEKYINEMHQILRVEYLSTDPSLNLYIEKENNSESAMSSAFLEQMVKSIYACSNGVYRMSPDIQHLVQSSNNLARVLVKDGEYSIQCLTRSSVDSEKMDLANSLQSAFELMGAKVDFKGSYPGWTPKPDASIVQIMSKLYEEMFQDKPLVNACHAGLECGILGTNYPEMEMISFGPNIKGAHSPDEKVQISSVQKFWKFLLETLKKIPNQSN